MSDIYNDMYKHLDPKRYREGPIDPRRITAGLALEQAFERAVAVHRAAEQRPGECMTQDGTNIYFTPDLFAFEGKRMVLGEIKCTWLSAKEVPISPQQSKESGLPCTWDGVSEPTFPKSFDKYFTQMHVYGYHLDTPWERLYVYFVNGNWRPPTPVFLSWDFEVSPREQYEEWLALKRHGEHMGVL